MGDGGLRRIQARGHCDRHTYDESRCRFGIGEHGLEEGEEVGRESLEGEVESRTDGRVRIERGAFIHSSRSLKDRRDRRHQLLASVKLKSGAQKGRRMLTMTSRIEREHSELTLASFPHILRQD